jgi:uncharacterized protein (DUF58 family)
MLARIQLAILAAVLVVGAFSTGAPFLFYLLYLLLIVVGGAYVITRLGLSDLEAGYALGQLHGSVGGYLRVTYTLRNVSRLPKPWLEVEHPSNLPVTLPGRALALGSHGDKTWLTRVPLTRRGHFRVDPLQVRTGDPFGLFESSAAVGSGATVVVYPRVDALPFFRLPTASLEGTHASRERAHQTTPLVSSVRPYQPGDAYNRIHWRTTARHQELFVREFDLEQAADVWIFLDLDRAVQVGTGDESTVEAGVRVAAAVGVKALAESRAVGITAIGRHVSLLPADRGARQHQKLMQLLAAAEADGTTPFVEVLAHGLGSVRRGMTALIITPSLDRAWVRPLAALRQRGVAAVVCQLDASAFQAFAETAPTGGAPTVNAEERAAREQDVRAVRRALMEYKIEVHRIVPRVRLGELLVTPGATAARRGAA